MDGIDCIKSRIIDNNTVRYETENGDTIIRLHLTDIITFKPNGDTIIHVGGWQTITTKDRINKFLLDDWQIFQEKNIWYLTDKDWHNPDRKIHVFQDGITIKKNGTVKNTGKDVKAIEKLDKKMKVYINGFMKQLINRKIDKPNGGDCWDCCLVDDNGRCMGDLSKSDHILSHFKDKYYVPSLLMNAIEEIPISQAAKHCIGYWMKYHDQKSEFYERVATPQIKKSLTRYLRRRLGMAA